MIDLWRLIRQYQALEDDGLVPVLKHMCGTKYITKWNEKTPDDPVLYCHYCNTTITFGQVRWEEISNEVQNHEKN